LSIPGGGEGGETWYSGFQEPISSSNGSMNDDKMSFLRGLGNGVPKSPRDMGALFGWLKSVLDWNGVWLNVRGGDFDVIGWPKSP